jgi:ABC-type glycerol-3-phosphate transport system permease component
VSDKTKTRLWLALLIFLDLAALTVAALLVGAGGFNQPRTVQIALAAALAVVSLALAFVPPLSVSRGFGIHGALVFGSLLFMFPFAWLVITSFKYPEEVVAYPPKWIPAAPDPSAQSPLVSGDLYDPPEPPVELGEERWQSLLPALEETLWREGSRLIPPEHMAGLDPETLREVLFKGLWSTLSPGMPPDAWALPDAALIEAVARRVTLERMEEVWNAVYRCVAIRPPFVTDLDSLDFSVDMDAATLARHADPVGEVDLRQLTPTLGGGIPMLQLAYDMSREPVAGVVLDLPLPVDADRLLCVTLPLRQDRTWHRIRVGLEFDGRRYESRSALYLGFYRWQEFVFKLMDRDSKDERDLGIWPLHLSADQAGAYAEPGKMRLTLGLHRSGKAAAIWHKYTQSYRNAWISGKHWPRYITNSVYLVVLTIIGQMLSCSMVAYAFSRLRWPGRDILFFVLLATMMLPGQVTMVPVFLVFRTLGWYNTLKPLWIPAFAGAPFFIFLLRQFMKGIPRELEEAALIDGCGYVGIYGHIMVPLIKPALAAVGIFTFMGTWNEFMGPLIYINDQRLYPLALGLFEFRAEFGGDFGMLMAASTIMILPVIIIFFFAQKYFIQGVTLTGMKN